MNKIICFLLFSITLLPAIVMAADLGTGSDGLANQIGAEGGYGTNVTDTSLSQAIGQGIKVVLGFVGTIFFALTVYAGFIWMTAQGNDEKVAQATGILRTAVIGMIVVLAAYGITTFVLIFGANATAGQSTTVGN